MPLIRRLTTRLRLLSHRKARQMGRLSRKSLQLGLLLGGAALVALVSLGFARLADLALEWNQAWVSRHGWLAFVHIPAAFALSRWLTLRLAPKATGSGHLQVIGRLEERRGGDACVRQRSLRGQAYY